MKPTTILLASSIAGFGFGVGVGMGLVFAYWLSDVIL